MTFATIANLEKCRESNQGGESRPTMASSLNIGRREDEGVRGNLDDPDPVGAATFCRIRIRFKAKTEL
jgi:hypothetical protein